MAAEQEILLAYDENPNALYSINQLAKRIKKAYPSVHKGVSQLVEKGILRRIPIGRSHLCAVNLDSQKAVMLLALNHIAKHETLPSHVHDTLLFLDDQKEHCTLHVAVYDPASDKLYAVLDVQPDNLREILLDKQIYSVSLDALRLLLLKNEDFYAQHVILTGYEKVFSLLTDPQIRRRYHPLL